MNDYWIGKGEGFTEHYKSSKLSPSYIARLFPEKRPEIIKRRVDSGNSILDISCGGGENPLLMSERFRRSSGMDISRRLAVASGALTALEGKRAQP